MEHSKNYSLKGKLTAENVQLLIQELTEQINKVENIKVCLKYIDKTDLAGFNVLIAAYMKARRSKKKLTYVNFEEANLRHLISQTNFTHVFCDN